MGLIHSRAAKKRNKAEARVLKDQHQEAVEQRRAAQKDAVAEKWGPVVEAIESGETTWDDLSRMQKLQMPISYQLKCKAAQKRRNAAQ